MSIDFLNMEFTSPWFLLLLVPIAGWLIFLIRDKAKRQIKLQFSHLPEEISYLTWKTVLASIWKYLRPASLIFLTLALARPGQSLQEEEVKAEGIDIFMVMDVSYSMLSRDFQPDRLEVSKQTAQDFVSNRPYDRFGLAVFSGESFTMSPLTTDRSLVSAHLASLQTGMLKDGTAIGMGLANAVNRLKDSKSKSKIAILLTDGENNAGYIDPLKAAKLASEFRIKIYAIGVGSHGYAEAPVRSLGNGKFIYGNAFVRIDEKLLREITSITGGKYFRAKDENALRSIYEEIDKLEKTEVEVSVLHRYVDKYRLYVLIGLLLLLLEWVGYKTILRTLP